MLTKSELREIWVKWEKRKSLLDPEIGQLLKHVCEMEAEQDRMMGVLKKEQDRRVELEAERGR